jgi:hypothetical protein
MKLSEYVDNNVRDYPLWSLILGSMVMILLAIGHVIRYKQSSRKPHYCFAFSLICLSVQYICATQDMNTAYLTLIADCTATLVNAILIFIWTDSMEKYINRYIQYLICFIVLALGVALGRFIIATLTELDYSSSSEDNRDSSEPDNIGLTIWQAALITSIVGSSILTCLTLLYQCFLCSKEYESKREKRLQLIQLFLLSSLLLVSKIDALYRIPLLYIIPFLLFHVIHILRHDSISSYYHKPDDNNV